VARVVRLELVAVEIRAAQVEPGQVGATRVAFPQMRDAMRATTSLL
jgi:hypothetical protein